jgi:hypothetical protein
MGIWRSESAARGDELAHADDDDGAATWRRIMAAVTQLASQTLPGPVHWPPFSLGDNRVYCVHPSKRVSRKFL